MKKSLWQRMLRAWSLWSGLGKPVMALPCNRIDLVSFEEAEHQARIDYENHLHRLVIVDSFVACTDYGAHTQRADAGQPFVVQVMETCTQDLTRFLNGQLQPIWSVRVIADHGCGVGDRNWIYAPTHRAK